MTTERWEVGPVLTRAWQLFKDNLGLILGAMIVMAIINGVFTGIGSGIEEVIGESRSGLVALILGPMRAAVGLVGWIVSVYLSLGLIQLLLKVIRGTGATIGDLFGGGRALVPGVLASLLVGAGVILGLAVLIVPGVILALGWMFVQALIVDRGMGPVEAMQESWRVTRGEKGGLFLWMLVCVGLCLLGLMACGVGLFVAAPVCGIGTLLIYEDLLERVEA